MNIHTKQFMVVALLSIQALVAGPIHDAVESGDVAKVQGMLKENPALANEAVRQVTLKSLGREVVQQRTPLTIAAKKRILPMAKALLDAGAKVDAPQVTTVKEIVITEQGGDYGRPQYQRVHSWKVTSEHKESPLDIALGSVDSTFCELFLTHGAKASDATLMRVVGSSSLRTPKVIELVIKNGASANATDSRGKSALHEAARWGDLPAVKVLITKGANANATYHMGRRGRRSKKMKAVDLAKKYNHDDVVAYLKPLTGLRGKLRRK